MSVLNIYKCVYMLGIYKLRENLGEIILVRAFVTKKYFFKNLVDRDVE